MSKNFFTSFKIEGKEEDNLKNSRRKINSWKNMVKSRKRWPLSTAELLAGCWASWAWLALPLWDGVAPAGWHEI